MFPSVGQLVSFVLLGLVLQVSGLNVNDPCTNPYGQAGRCINFRECQPIAAIWNKPVVSPEESQFVQASQCGAGGLACCPGVTARVAAPVTIPTTTTVRTTVRTTVPTPAKKATLPKPPHCGKNLDDRIYGGQVTKVDEYPWVALLHYSKPQGRTGYHCGGSLINSRYVLTAAHCIQAIPRGWSVIGVRLGEWDLNTTHDCEDDDNDPSTPDFCSDDPVDLGIDKIIVHENYQPQLKAQYDDIALIRLNRDVTFSQFIDPVCLPLVRGSTYNKGSKGWAAGFGRTETASASNVKLKVELEFNDLNTCKNVYRSSQIALRDTQLCAGGIRGLDTCSGDSGGPLTRLDKANYFLYGIVSFGPNKCGTKGVPGVYTNVAKYIDWIESKLEVCCAGLPSTTSRSSGSKVSLLKPPNCGVDLSDRIVGGQQTALDQYPWTALIHYSKPNGRTGYHCGGSLINSRYVLTAAHCIQAIPRTWNVIGVRLGEWDLDSTIDQKDGEVADAPLDLGVEKIIVHENYQPTNKAQYDDIALIRFNRDVSFSDFVRPICLPVDAQYRNRNNVATQGVAVGWGRTEKNAASNVKLKVSLEFKDFRSCANVYKPAGITLRDTQLCAGGVRGQDTCSGDSGGPLSKIEKANHFLYGIVSFGPNKCGTAGVPGVYTNVAKYIEWIESNLE